MASKLILLLIVFYLNCVHCERKNSSSRSVVIKDIHSTVNDIYDSVQRSESSLDLNMKTIQTSIQIVQSKIERIGDVVDLNKVNVHLINEHLIKLDEKMKNVENQINQQLIKQFNEKINSFEILLQKLNDSIDLKLKKMNNVLIQTYEFTKDIKNIFEQLKQDKHVEDGDDDINFNQVQKAIKEQISVLGIELKTQLNSLSTTQLNLRSQVDLIGSQLLLIQDDLTPKRHRNSIEHFITNQGQSNNLTQTIQSNHLSIINQIDYGFNKLERKVDQLCPSSMERVTMKPQVSHDQNDIFNTEVSTKRESKSITSIEPKLNQLNCNRITKSVSSSSCYEIRKQGADCDGIYELNLPTRNAKVYCDMTDIGGGWTIIMRRGKFDHNKGIQFNKTWFEYKTGFGLLDDEFWLGNDLIHLLTSMEPNELQIDLEAYDGDFISLRYDHFIVANENDDYKMKIDKAKSNQPIILKIAASFANHNNMKFSTYDKNNSGGWSNCALKYGGGWWFDSIMCYYVFLNAPYSVVERRRNAPQGIIWQSWKNQTLKAVQMKIRTKH